MATDTANQAILTRLESMPQFHPLTANLFTDWTLDPGDVVTVRQGETNYTVPIFQLNVDWRGKPTVEVQSTGSEKRPAASILRKSGYGGGRRQEEQEIEMVRFNADIDKSNKRISLWATEEQWDEIEEEYDLSRRTAFNLTSDGIESLALETGSTRGVHQFDPTHSYVYGEKCMYNGVLYRCKNQSGHTGAWDVADFETVQSQQSMIQQNAGRIALVVDQNGIRRGQILLAINGEGGSQALIEADSIDINGVVTALESLSVSVGSLHVEGQSEFLQSASFEEGLSSDEAIVSHGGYYVGPISTGQYLNVANVVPSGDSLIITYVDGTHTTFSRATTLTGAWSGGGFPYIVSASPQGNQHTIGFGSYGAHDLDLEIRANGSVTKSSSAYSVDVPITLNSLNSGQTAPTSRYTKNLTVSVSGVLEERTTAGTGKITANGTYYPDPSNYVGFSAVEVDVSGGGGNPQSSKTITASIIGTTVTPDTGYDSMEQVVINRATLGTRQSTLPVSEASKVISGTIDANGFWPVGDGYVYAYFSGGGSTPTATKVVISPVRDVPSAVTRNYVTVTFSDNTTSSFYSGTTAITETTTWNKTN